MYTKSYLHMKRDLRTCKVQEAVFRKYQIYEKLKSKRKHVKHYLYFSIILSDILIQFNFVLIGSCGVYERNKMSMFYYRK